MATTSHRYDFGLMPIEVHDRVVEQLANGAAKATCVWMQWRFKGESPPKLHELKLTYAPAPGDTLDCQDIRCSERFLEPGKATCIDLAIYCTAWRMAHGWDVEVAIIRSSDREPAHAVVHHPHQAQLDFDPINYLGGP